MPQWHEDLDVLCGGTGKRIRQRSQLTPGQREEALLWLAGYDPAVFDAVAEAVELCQGDGADDPAPFCARCGADIGVFLKLGLDWRHYKATTLDNIELFEPSHAPVLAWRIHVPATCPASRTRRVTARG